MTETSAWPKRTRAAERARAEGAERALVGIVGVDRAAELCDLYELPHAGSDPPPTEAEAVAGNLSDERRRRGRCQGAGGSPGFGMR